MGSDWSGLVTVDSLPHEYRAKESRNIRALQAALGTPSPEVSEFYRGAPAGFPAITEALAGGSMQVRVNTLPRPSQPLASYPDNLDRYELKAYQRAKFTEFFANMVTGRMPVREYSQPVGPVSRPTGSPNYRPFGMDYGRSQPYRPLPGEPGFGEPYSINRRLHPAYSSYTSDTREEARLHDGDCGSVHPYQTHRDWASSEEEEEERRGTRERLIRNYKRALIAERQTVSVRESQGWHWCSEHQRWTRN